MKEILSKQEQKFCQELVHMTPAKFAKEKNLLVRKMSLTSSCVRAQQELYREQTRRYQFMTELLNLQSLMRNHTGNELCIQRTAPYIRFDTVYDEYITMEMSNEIYRFTAKIQCYKGKYGISYELRIKGLEGETLLSDFHKSYKTKEEALEQVDLFRQQYRKEFSRIRPAVPQKYQKYFMFHGINLLKLEESK